MKDDQRANDRHLRKEDLPCAEHGVELAKLETIMSDFISQSTLDRKACEARYAQDREESRTFRNDVINRLENLEKFIEGLKPDHKMLMMLAMGIIVGALALVWRLIWTNIKWGGG